MANNEILQIVVFSMFFGVALAALGDKGRTLVAAIDELSHVMLKITGYVMKLAPLAVELIEGFLPMLPMIQELMPAILELMTALLPLVPVFVDLLIALLPLLQPLMRFQMFILQLLTSKAIVPLIELLAGALGLVAKALVWVVEKIGEFAGSATHRLVLLST